MCTKEEWEECAERRLVENLALRVISNEIEMLVHQRGGGLSGSQNFEITTLILERIQVAKEVGR